MQRIIVDTGVWYAICDTRDPFHSKIDEKIAWFEENTSTIIIPWPILYETLKTRFVKNKIAVSTLELKLKSPRMVFIDDAKWREDAIELAIHSTLRSNRSLSMVDCLIRLMLEDVNLRVDALMTFNERDFVDVCTPRNIELL